MTEKMAYHAIATLLDGDYRALSRAKEKHATWERAWESTREENKGNVDLREAWSTLEKHAISLILLDNPDYPPLLKEITYPPHGLYVKGELPKERTFTLSIVGTRKATRESISMAEEFAKQAVNVGAVIISGLALGIDAAAHKGALRGGGVTVAVLGNGLDRYYPAHHQALAEEILKKGGAIVSECPPGSPVYPSRFLERNRIISGLSQGVLIIEAPQRSGSLATAHFALEANRDVFVIPGPARHPHFMGSHDLIRRGAELVTVPEHIFERYDALNVAQETSMDQSTNEEERIVLGAIKTSSTPLTIDKIVEITNLNAQTVNQATTFLAVKGKIKETNRGYAI